jgi:hypothetical protein|tara:strand:- start:393 stop:989 length:597 start_codon:yes stop_codon:yes gene_type:complete
MSLDYTELVVAESRTLIKNKNLLVVEVIQDNHPHYQREFLVNLKPKDDWVRELGAGKVVFLLNKFWSGDTREFTELAPLKHQLQDYQDLAVKKPMHLAFDFEQEFGECVIDDEVSDDSSGKESRLLPVIEAESGSGSSRPNNSIHIKNLDDSFMDEFDKVLELSGLRYKTMLAKRLIEIGLPIYRQIHGDLLERHRRP